MREKAPISDQKPVFKIPEVELLNLSNGIKIYHIKDTSGTISRLSIMIGKGAAQEEKWGLASFASDMLTGGTTTKTEEQISDLIEQKGSSIFMSSSWDKMNCGVSALKEHFNEAVDLLEDCFLNSTFPEEIIEKNKKKHIGRIRQSLSEPSHLSQIGLYKMFYEGKPYSHPASGTINTINSIERSDCVAYREGLGNAGATVFVTGDMDIDAISKKIENILKGFQPYSQGKLESKMEPRKQIAGIIGKSQSVQTNFKMAKSTVNAAHEDYPGIQLANAIFGGYFLSRLNKVIRETKGLTYGIGSFLDNRMLGTALVIGSSVNMNNTFEAITDVFEIAGEFATVPLETEEMNRAIQYLLGSFARSIETNSQVLSLFQTIELYGLEENYFEKFYSKLNSYTAEELFKIQRQYFKPENFVISTAGDAEHIRKELSGLVGYEIKEIATNGEIFP